MLIGMDTQQAQHLHQWLMICWEIDKMIVGAVLLDFSATFDIIDHSLLLEKAYVLWLHTTCYNVDKELLVLMDAYQI